MNFTLLQGAYFSSLGATNPESKSNIQILIKGQIWATCGVNVAADSLRLLRGLRSKK